MRKELIGRFKQFCSNLNEKDRIALLHHSDPDGFCSALIVMKAVEQLVGKLPEHISHYEYSNQDQAKILLDAAKKKKLNKLIIVDIGIDGDKNHKRLFGSFENVLVIDHHKIYNDLNSEKIVFLKAKWFLEIDSAQYACSKFCFDLFNKVLDLSSLDWVACVGLIGDMCFNQWKEFVKETMKKRNIKLDDLNALVDLIAATEVMDEKKMNKLLLAFHKTKQPKQLLKSIFRKHLEALRKERDRLVGGFEGKADYFPELELFVYEIKTDKEGIKSYVVNEISQMHPGKTVILIQDAGNSDLRISARRQDYKLKMNELLEQSIKGLKNACGGGHAPAAAARIEKKDLKKFKTKLMKVVEGMMK